MSENNTNNTNVDQVEFTLNDLVEGTGLQNVENANNAYEVYKEDVEENSAKRKENFKKKKNVNDFYKTTINNNNNVFGAIINKFNDKNNTRSIMLKKKIQIEFETKMRRINKIKSKKFKKSLKAENKKLRLQTEDVYGEMDSDTSEEESCNNIENKKMEFKPVLEFNNDKDNFLKEKTIPKRKNQNVLFESTSEEESEDMDKIEKNDEDSFVKEKVEVMKADAPTTIETVLPGFDGEWVGADIEVVKNNKNTIKYFKEGIAARDRLDFSKSNVIINENVEYDQKYSITNVPYGYTEDMMDERMKIFRK